MSTLHINADAGAFAKVVLMPGDPLRAKWMAETYLTNYKEVCNQRGILGFTGYSKNGKRISIMASGMGIPSIGIYSRELYDGHGVETIIRVGTCGAYQEEINLRDIIIAQNASTDSNWVYQYDLQHFSAGASFDVMLAAYEAAIAMGKKPKVGNVLSADIFYDEDPLQWKKWAKLNVLAVEMESYALYCNAARYKKRALCILTVTDHFIKKGALSSEERQLGLGEMIEVAIAAAEKFAD